MPKHRVFISHSSTDAEVALSTAQALEASGVPAWVAPRDVPAGADFMTSIMHAIGACDALAVILSPDAVASPHVLREVTVAVANHRPLFVFATDRSTVNYASLPPNWQFMLAVAQIAPLTSAQLAAGVMAAALPGARTSLPGAGPAATSEVPSTGQPDQNVFASVAGDAAAAAARAVDQRLTLAESLKELRAAPAIAELLGTLAVRATMHHRYLASAKYLTLHPQRGGPVSAYVKRSSISIPMWEADAAVLMSEGIGELERKQGRRHYVRVRAEDLGTDVQRDRVEDAISRALASQEN
ncbi:toll/interleukin-1 receptor domain-containing protein [Georgenia sp. SYP-B2076]|uniref:toll/interleukin-1 receptor domain-containing protein n=1 Tax=Georgenia sp. SYP-B2076 TaxID=2495881 RepID=UPI0013DF2C29|nr:toll/interleukin-1 receptor domain-containing protein [Georgenia sp. SYP-B2076]